MVVIQNLIQYMYFLIIFIFIDCSKLLIGMVTPMYNKPLTEK